MCQTIFTSATFTVCTGMGRGYKQQTTYLQFCLLPVLPSCLTPHHLPGLGSPSFCLPHHSLEQHSWDYPCSSPGRALRPVPVSRPSTLSRTSTAPRARHAGARFPTCRLTPVLPDPTPYGAVAAYLTYLLTHATRSVTFGATCIYIPAPPTPLHFRVDGDDTPTRNLVRIAYFAAAGSWFPGKATTRTRLFCLRGGAILLPLVTWRTLPFDVVIGGLIQHRCW